MSEYKHPAVRISTLILLLTGLMMIYFQFSGATASMDWSLATEPQMEKIVAHQFQKGPFEFKIFGEKVTLSEYFYGESIKDLDRFRTSCFIIILLAIALITAGATYLKQLGFLIYSGLFIFFLLQLQIHTLLGQQNWILLIPFLLIIGTAYYFHAFRTNTLFITRISALILAVTVTVLVSSQNITDLSLHFFAHGILPLALLIFIYLAIIAEELVFGLLYLLTRNNGGKNNHVHLLALGGIYVLNLLGYYLNKAGLMDFTFTFLNPYLLLFISAAVSIWSLKFKAGLLGSLHLVPAMVMIMAAGIITFTVVSFGFAQGLFVIPESIHYLIVYTHLAFGFFFLIYLIINFIDPLYKGFSVYKVVYKPQTFHYASARLIGLVMVATFFFLSSQVSYKLLRSARFNLLGDIERQLGNDQLSATYYENAEFYGYNSHYANYRLGTYFMEQRKQAEARRHFDKATRRFPTPQAFLNASNLQPSSDLSLSKSILLSGLNTFPDQPELKNNLGIVNWKNGLHEQAYNAFARTESSQDWNQAPTANKWGTLASLRELKDEQPEKDFIAGNAVVQSNILSALLATGIRPELSYDTSSIRQQPYALHRQSFLLNALYFFEDTVFQSMAGNELLGQSPGIQAPLHKALAMNKYLTGNVKGAFQVLDQIQTGRSGRKAGEILNEMGLLALDQHAPMEARDFFTMAMEKGYQEAAFNRLVAFLEYGDFNNARLQLAELIQENDDYETLQTSLINVFVPGTDTTREAVFNELYYRSIEMAPEILLVRLQTFDEPARQLVMRKILAHCENLSVDPQKYGLQFPDLKALDSTAIIFLSKRRPFDENLILEAHKLLSEKEPITGYNFLLESLEFNPYSIPLLKAHALAAIDLNLPDYAGESLVTLSNLLDPVAYYNFEKAWYARKAERESSWPY